MQIGSTDLIGGKSLTGSTSGETPGESGAFAQFLIAATGQAAAPVSAPNRNVNGFLLGEGAGTTSNIGFVPVSDMLAGRTGPSLDGAGLTGVQIPQPETRSGNMLQDTQTVFQTPFSGNTMDVAKPEAETPSPSTAPKISANPVADPVLKAQTNGLTMTTVLSGEISSTGTGVATPQSSPPGAVITAQTGAETGASMNVTAQAPPTGLVLPLMQTLMATQSVQPKPLSSDTPARMSAKSGEISALATQLAGSGQPQAGGLASPPNPGVQTSATPNPVIGQNPGQADLPANLQTADGGEFADLLPENDLDSVQQPNSQRVDARTVEAAAQNALKGGTAPHMAAMVSRVGEHFLERFNGRNSSFEIRLDPAELGKVSVRVEIGADGKVMAVLAARDPAVVDALMRGAKTLENALTQAGINLSEEGVTVQLDQRDSSGSPGAKSDEFAQQLSPGIFAEDDAHNAAGESVPVNPVIERWSRHRLNLTA